MPKTNLDAAGTALVLIDLQKGIFSYPLAPRTSAEVAKAARLLTESFRAAGAPVILVNVSWAKDWGDALRQPVDRPMPRPAAGFPPEWSELIDGLAQPGDIRLTKHQWGAFHGTDLDLQLRRRRINTVVLGGIATNMGVESTARQAWEHGYEVVIAEDATTSLSAEMHNFSVTTILPLIARVLTTDDLELSQNTAAAG
jgi:nicotinamidase-related amidase